MVFNSPLSEAKAHQIIGSLPVSPGDRVVDVGCGSGEFLIRLIESKGVQGLGVDPNTELIATAQKTTAQRIPDASCEFMAASILDLTLDEHAFALAVCLGATHAYGSGDAAYPNTLRELTRLVQPGGLLLIGEGYWKQTPAEEYLALIGTPTGIYHSHSENIAFAEQRGFATLGAFVSNDDEWDQFEWSHQQRIELQHAADPENPAIAQKLHRRREWMKGYLRWGRATMGFGFYLFQTPASEASMKTDCAD